MYKPKKCPKCKSEKVLKIMYGLPAGPTPPGEYEGGCCITGEDPNWHCGDCNWEWGPDCEGRYGDESEESIALAQDMVEGVEGKIKNQKELKQDFMENKIQSLREEIERKDKTIQKQTVAIFLLIMFIFLSILVLSDNSCPILSDGMPDCASRGPHIEW